MENTASAKELLDDLTRLSQVGRLRYMKTMSQDVLIEVPSHSLQASDDSSNALKRSILRAEKRIKIENDIVPKEEAEAKEIDSDDDDIAAPAVQSQATTMATRTSMQTRSLTEPPLPSEQLRDPPMVFLLPSTDTLVDMARFPADVQAELQRRFHETWTLSGKRKNRYRGMQSKPQNRLNKEVCIRFQFLKWAGRDGGVTVTTSTAERPRSLQIICASSTDARVCTWLSTTESAPGASCRFQQGSVWEGRGTSLGIG